MKALYAVSAALLLLFGATIYLAISQPNPLLSGAKIFDPLESRSFVHYAIASYCSNEVLQQWNCGSTCNQHPKMTDVAAFYNPAHSGKGYVGYDPESNLIVVSIRGSSDLKNWIADFRMWMHNYDKCADCQVQDGFYVVYNDVKKDLLEQVRKLHNKYPTAQALLTGHSLGGAVASLAALDVVEIMPVYQLHTYGCPRVGNAAFAKYLNERLASSSGVWRIVSFHDPFTHVPQKSLGYEHYSQEVWFNSRDLSNINKYKVCTGNEDSSCSSSVNTLLYNPMDHMSYLGVDMNADCPR